ncbi:LysR family transcriptional regulator [uncultured Nostoc sp.]|uniref:LysR family transcriptional regulator n=1 Tax=uncultured Nostoc sp. TaxID=340711 RepID=UPI0035CBD624
MNLAEFDLKALLVFDAVMTERSTTKAGYRLAMSQPAVSSALNRLRYALKDELFIRGADGMRPTPCALELAAPIRQALTQLSEALQPVEFIPANASRTFTFAMTDDAASLILPTLAERLEKVAPNIDIRVKPNININAPELLDSGEIDFAIGFFPNPPERLQVTALIKYEFVCAMRRKHPLAGKPLELHSYLSAKHLLVSLSGKSTGFVDVLLESQGLRRRIAMTVNQFSVVPAILRQSNLIVTVVCQVITLSPYAKDLVVQPVPLAIEPIALSLLWHGRLSQHPANTWMRSTIFDICAEISNGFQDRIQQR